MKQDTHTHTYRQGIFENLDDVQISNAVLFNPCYERRGYSKSIQERYNAQHPRISNLFQLTFSLLLEKLPKMKVSNSVAK